MAANSWDNNRARREEGRPVAAHLRRHARRADHAGTSCSSSATTRASSATVRASRSCRWRPRPGAAATSRRRRRRSAIPRPASRSRATQIPSEPVQPDRARRARQPDSCTRCRTVPGDTNNLVDGSLGQAAGVPGRRQGRREPRRATTGCSGASRTRSTSRSRNGRALESQLTGTNDSPFLGLAFNWTRTLERERRQRAARRLHAR